MRPAAKGFRQSKLVSPPVAAPFRVRQRRRLKPAATGSETALLGRNPSLHGGRVRQAQRRRTKHTPRCVGAALDAPYKKRLSTKQNRFLAASAGNVPDQERSVVAGGYETFSIGGEHQ